MSSGGTTPGPATGSTPDDGDGELDGDGVDTFGGTDDNLVVGPSTGALIRPAGQRSESGFARRPSRRHAGRLAGRTRRVDR
jgi:hypothetical protein